MSQVCGTGPTERRPSIPSASELLEHLQWPDLLNHLADDVEWQLPPGLGEQLSGSHRGLPAVTEMLNFIFNVFYDPTTVSPEVKMVVPGDDNAAMFFTMVAKTQWGQPYRNEYSIAIEAANGKITKVYELMDTKHLADTIDVDQFMLSASRYSSSLHPASDS